MGLDIIQGFDLEEHDEDFDIEDFEDHGKLSVSRTLCNFMCRKSVVEGEPTLNANQSGGTYQWITCPEPLSVPGETNQSFTATTNGSYAVVVTANGCTDTSACETITGLGFIENEFGSGCIIFPNPTDGQFTIDLGEVYPSVNISITDLSGKLILCEEYQEGQLFQMKFEDPAGIYLLTIEAEGKKAVVHLVKE